MKYIFSIFVALSTLFATSCAIETSNTSTVCIIGDSRVQHLNQSMFPANTEISIFSYSAFSTAMILDRMIDIAEQYDIIIISAGINDSYYGMSTIQSFDCLSKIVAISQSKSSKVFLTTIPGCRFGEIFDDERVSKNNNAASALNSIIGNLSALPININNVLCESDGVILRKVYSLDGVHYNEAGLTVFADILSSYL